MKNSSDVPTTVHLPHDLVLLILSRFPVKSLLRAKSVCRSWLQSLSSPHFARLHFTSSFNPPNLLLELPDSTNPNPNFLLVHPSEGASDISFNFLPDRVKIRASCNGILCCASVSVRGLFYICNPITNQFRSILRSVDRHVTRFHPDCDTTLVGLAYDAVKLKFSLVLAGFRRIFGRHHHDDRFVCQVFDSEANAWRRFVCQLYDEFTHMNRNQVVYSNGLLHWLTHSLCYILVLDFENEIWTKISLPDDILGRRGYGQRVYLLDFEGCLSVVQMTGNSMNIWLLKDYELEKWVLEDKVNLGCVGVFAASAFPVCQSRDVMFLATQKMILVYGRKSKEWKVVYAMNYNVTYPLWFSAHPFRSTLFPCH